jgi:hypothetical protein
MSGGLTDPLNPTQLLALLWGLLSGAEIPPLDPASGIAPAALADLAEAHGVAPLLYKKISGLPQPFSAAVIQKLESSYYQSAGRAQLLQAELDRLAAAFDGAGLPWLPLKGAALAWSVYPDPALRPMNDLDLLVAPRDLLTAVRLAGRLGYRFEKLTYHALLRGGPAAAVPLELHWTLPGGFPLNIDLANLSKNLRSKFFERFTYQYSLEHLLRQHAASPRLIWRYDLLLLRQRLGDSPPLAAPGALAPAPFLDNTKASLRLLPAGALLRLAGSLLFPSSAYLKWRYHPQPEWTWPLYYFKRGAEWLGEIVGR